MDNPTLSETIKEITKCHLSSGGLLFAQNVTAVGWIANTVPSDMPNNQGIVELPTSDSSNSAIVVGAALAGKWPIYVIRYQGFLWYNAASIVNYAAKSLHMWGIHCPVFVRGLAMEGGIGPVASHAHHGMLMRMPGIAVAAPVLPKEWEHAWENFCSLKCPFFVSEHRKTYGFTNEHEKELEFQHPESKITVIGVSFARQNAALARKQSQIPFSTYGIHQLKPLIVPEKIKEELRKTKLGLVVDCDYNVCGASEHIALTLSLETGARVYPLGLPQKVAGFSKSTDVTTPSPELINEHIKKILK